MKAKRLMTVNVTWVSPELPLDEANALMQDLRVRHLPVVEDGKLSGILSNEDVLLHAIPDVDGTPEVPPIPVADVMTEAPITCTPDTSAAAIAAVMLGQKIDAVPIVNNDGALVGLVTSADLLALLCAEDSFLDNEKFEFSLRSSEETSDEAKPEDEYDELIEVEIRSQD